MNTPTFDFGMIGLGVMGRNFILNVADNGFSAIGLDTAQEKATALESEGRGKPVKGTTSVDIFVRSLKTPRRIMLLVPAGHPVDAVISDLLPRLSPGDLIIDGGNSYFADTDRRLKELARTGIHFMGTGVSGGAKGARLGPSIMPGGSPDAYALIRPVFEAVAAKVNGDPCVAYMGKGSAGHYVKMVHNGIEYGLMQLIAEAYDLLKNAGRLPYEALQAVFRQWNNGKLRSFLIGITANILAHRDEETDGLLVDKILDKAKQKGTGKWTSQDAMNLGIPIPTIDAAVTMRGLSALKSSRIKAAAALTAPVPAAPPDQEGFIRQVEQALYFAFIVTYAQGMSLLKAASEEYGYGLRLAEIAEIWRAGCIIRADLLESIRQAYTGRSDLENLLLSEPVREDLLQGYEATQTVVRQGMMHHIPLLAMSSALFYFEAFRSARLPLNLVQAQRDYFGSHTYERTDKEGVFHTEWE